MTESFAEAAGRALEQRETGLAIAPSGRVAVDTGTGEIVYLQDAPHEQLADMLADLRAHEAQLREWKAQVEEELVRRHGDRRSAQTVGPWEVDVDRQMGRVWDPEELTEVAKDLVHRGLLTIGAVDGLIKVERKVDGRRAQRLLERVEGDALVELRSCFAWEQKGRPKVKLTPVASLEP